MRSSGRRPVRRVRRYAHGLNLVVITLRVHAPWAGEPLGLPVNLRLFRKGGPTHAQLVQEMIAELAGWLPERSFTRCGDGAYATLAGSGLPRTHLVSRIRRDAARPVVSAGSNRPGTGVLAFLGVPASFAVDLEFSGGVSQPGVVDVAMHVPVDCVQRLA